MSFFVPPYIFYLILLSSFRFEPMLLAVVQMLKWFRVFVFCTFASIWIIQLVSVSVFFITVCVFGIEIGIRICLAVYRREKVNVNYPKSIVDCEKTLFKTCICSIGQYVKFSSDFCSLQAIRPMTIETVEIWTFVISWLNPLVISLILAFCLKIFME